MGQEGLAGGDKSLTNPLLTSRVLCCFAFSLSQDWELPAKREVGGVGLVRPVLMELPKPFTGWLRWGHRVLVSVVRNHPSHAQGL